MTAMFHSPSKTLALPLRQALDKCVVDCVSELQRAVEAIQTAVSGLQLLVSRREQVCERARAPADVC